MSESELNNLITAFTYPVSLLNYSFYWNKREQRVLEISLFEINDDPNGMFDDMDNTVILRDNLDLIPIPQIEVQERLNMMKDFINLMASSEDKNQLEERFNEITDATMEFTMRHFRDGLVKGVDFESLTASLNNKTKETWSNFYRPLVTNIINTWLSTIK